MLYDYRRNLLNPEEQAQVQQHIKECPDCRTALDETNELLVILDQIKPPAISPTFQAQVMEKISKEEERRQSQRLSLSIVLERIFVRWTYVHAIAGIILLGIFVICLNRFLLKSTEITGINYRGIELSHPIQVEIEETHLEQAEKQLLTWIEKNQGKLVQRKDTAAGIVFTINLAQTQEAPFFQGLSQIGMASIPKDKYRDQKGNMILILKVRK